MAEQPDMTTDLAPVPKPGPTGIAVGSRGMVLASYDDVWRFAGCLAQSGLAPRGMEKRESIVIAMQLGAEIGLPPMAAIQNVAVINGRPSLWGDAMLGVCQTSREWDRGQFREWVDGEGDQTTAHCRVGRVGYEPAEAHFSIADAKRANLWGKAGPWTQYPRRMLQMRARSWALRDAFSDVLRGMCAREEAEDIIDVQAQVVDRQTFNGNAAAGALPAPSSTVSALEQKLAAQRQASEQAKSKPVEQAPPPAVNPAPASSPKSGTKNRTSTPKQAPPAAPVEQAPAPESKPDPLAPDPNITLPEKPKAPEPDGDSLDGLFGEQDQSQPDAQPGEMTPEQVNDLKQDLWNQGKDIMLRIRALVSADAAKLSEAQNRSLAIMDASGIRGKKAPDCSLDGLHVFVQAMTEYEQQVKASLPKKK